ncbi:dipeptidyl peptidase IV [Hyaloraphidium curvatum]|nr:dipeptidyl peptidase IV [Hyaloraphidium curvatum]
MAVPATFLRDLSETRRFAAGRPVGVRVVPGAGGADAVFLRSGPRSNRQTLFRVALPADASGTAEAVEILSPEKLIGKPADGELSAAEKALLERMRVAARGFISYQTNREGSAVLTVFSGRMYLYDLGAGSVRPLGTDSGVGPAIDPKFTDDYVFFVRDNDVWRVSLDGNVEEQLTFGGTEAKPNGLAEFVAQEEMHRFTGYWPSPDSSMLCFQQTDNDGVEVFHISDPIMPEKAPQPFFYPRPGRKNAAVKLGVVSLDSKDNVVWLQIDWDRYPYVVNVNWPRAPADSGAPSPLAVVVMNREQTDMKLLVCTDFATGAMTELLAVRDEAWINIDQAFPCFVWDQQAGAGFPQGWAGWKFLFATEEEPGWRVGLYSLPAPGSGKAAALVETWVEPTAGYTKLVGYDEDAGTLYYRGGPNPTENYVFAVSRGGDGKLATRRVSSFEGKGVEDAALVGTEGTGRFLSLVRTDLATMPRTFLFRCSPSSTSPVLEVPSVAESPGFSPNVTVEQLPAPKDFWTAVIRPHGFDPAKERLPVILQVYGGPHHLEVQHACLPNLVLQWLADRTRSVVVKLDGRGTPGRGRAWERAIKYDLLTAPVMDQCDGVRGVVEHVLKGQGVVDVAKDGILGCNGWSYGGYMSAAMAMLGEKIGRLKVANAVAGAPVTEWLLYDTTYTERYLGVPDLADSANTSTKAYAESSLLNRSEVNARLLLIHGTADDNVYFSHSLQLVDHLFRAGAMESDKVQLLPVANLTHMVPEPAIMQRMWERIASFLSAK